MVIVMRILIGSFLSGNMFAIIYSMAGSFLCLRGMSILRRILSDERIWFCSIAGAVLHNTGQIIIAILVTRTTALVSYLPVLIVTGVLAGFFTGLCAQFVYHRICGRKQLKVNHQLLSCGSVDRLGS